MLMIMEVLTNVAVHLEAANEVKTWPLDVQAMSNRECGAAKNRELSKEKTPVTQGRLGEDDVCQCGRVSLGEK